MLDPSPGKSEIVLEQKSMPLGALSEVADNILEQAALRMASKELEHWREEYHTHLDNRGIVGKARTPEPQHPPMHPRGRLVATFLHAILAHCHPLQHCEEPQLPQALQLLPQVSPSLPNQEVAQYHLPGMIESSALHRTPQVRRAALGQSQKMCSSQEAVLESRHQESDMCFGWTMVSGSHTWGVPAYCCMDTHATA